jgi:hypothetical protein
MNSSQHHQDFHNNDGGGGPARLEPDRQNSTPRLTKKGLKRGV